MKKILIIKTGYSETVDKEVSRVSSMGDVLRTTVLLHKFKDDHVTWVVDEKSYDLLKGNPYIARILIWDVATSLQLMHEIYDIVINLEKVPGICALATVVRARTRYGFYFDFSTGEARAYDWCDEVFGMVSDEARKRNHGKKWQELLMGMIGEKYEGEEYILRKPDYGSCEIKTYSVGLNFRVGNKWPSKKWPKEYWDDLRLRLISKGVYYSDQPEETNLDDYIDWVNRCDILVTCDSLGMHIALALGKKVIVLCGPTNTDEIDLYGRGVLIKPNNDFICPEMPCLSPKCINGKNCMEYILPEEVFAEIEKMLEDK